MEFYTAEFAIKYLAKKLTTENDAKALNKIIEEINTKGVKDSGNELFTKLYLHIFAQGIETYGDTHGVRREIGSLLRKPTSHYLQEIKDAYLHVLLTKAESNEDIINVLQKPEIGANLLRKSLNNYMEQELNDKKNYDTND